MKRKSIILLSDWENHVKGTAISMSPSKADQLIKDGKADPLDSRYQTPAAPAKKAAKKAAKKDK